MLKQLIIAIIITCIIAPSIMMAFVIMLGDKKKRDNLLNKFRRK